MIKKIYTLWSKHNKLLETDTNGEKSSNLKRTKDKKIVLFIQKLKSDLIALKSNSSSAVVGKNYVCLNCGQQGNHRTQMCERERVTMCVRCLRISVTVKECNCKSKNLQ